MIRRIIFAAALVFVSQSADASVKKNVMDNCAGALAELPALSPEERRDLLPYLEQVLKLKTSAPEDLPILSPPGEPPLPFDFTRSSEPTRNVEAKRCAVKILRTYGADALGAVVELIPLVIDQTLASDLRDGAYEAIREISVDAGKKPDVQVAPGLVQLCIELLGGPATFTCEGIFVELGSRVAPRLLDGLKRPDRSRREEIGRMLFAIDSDGATIGPGVLELLASGDDGVRKRAAAILGRLTGFLEQSLPPLVGRLEDVSADVQDQALRSIETVVAHHQGTFQIPQPAAETLVRALRRYTGKDQGAVSTVLSRALSGTPEQIQLIVPLLSDADSGVRVHALSVLAQADRTPQTLQHILAALYNPLLPVRLAAIRALRFRTDAKGDVSIALRRLLKGNSGARDSNVRESILSSVARTVADLAPLPDQATMLPFFVDGLAIPDGAPIVDAIASSGPSAVPPLLKSLKAKDALIRRRAAETLGRIAPADAKAAAALADLLRAENPDTVSTAVDALVKIGPAAAAPLERRLKSDTRASAAEALLRINPAHVQARAVLAEKFAAAPCKEKVRLSSILPKEVSVPALVRCLESEDWLVIDRLHSSAPLPADAKAELLRLLDKMPAARRVFILEKGKALGFSPDELTPQLITLIAGADDAAKYRAIGVLGSFGTAAHAASAKLGEIVADRRVDDLIRHEAVVALAQIDPGSFDWASFFIRELEDGRSDWVRRALERLGPALSVPLIERAFQTKGLSAQAIGLSGALGAEGKPLAGYIRPFLDSKEAAVRSTAIVSLLKIDPGLPELLPVLRHTLVLEAGQRLRSEDLGASLRPLLEQILSSPLSKLEEKSARELLASLK